MRKEYHITILKEDGAKARNSALIFIILLGISQLALANWSLLIEFPQDIINAFLGSGSAVSTTLSGNYMGHVFPHADYALIITFILNLLIFFLIKYRIFIFTNKKNQIITLNSKPKHIFDWIAKYVDILGIIFVVLLDIAIQILSSR